MKTSACLCFVHKWQMNALQNFQSLTWPDSRELYGSFKRGQSHIQNLQPFLCLPPPPFEWLHNRVLFTSPSLLPWHTLNETMKRQVKETERGNRFSAFFFFVFWLRVWPLLHCFSSPCLSLSPTLTHPCTSIFVTTFIGLMYCPAPCPDPNPILNSELKPGLNPQTGL